MEKRRLDMNSKTNNLASVLQKIKDEYELQIFRKPQFIAIFRDLAPDLQREAKFLSMLVESKHINTIFEIAKEESEKVREVDINRLELIIEDSELIPPTTSDYYIRTLLNVLGVKQPEKTLEKAPENSEVSDTNASSSPMTSGKSERTDGKQTEKVLEKAPGNSKTSGINASSSPMALSKSVRNRNLLIAAGVILLALVLVTTVILSRNPSINKDSDDKNDLSRFIEENIEDVAEQFGEKVEKSGDVYTFSNFSSDSILLTMDAKSNGLIYYVELIHYDPTEVSKYNIEGVAIGMDESEAETNLKDNGFVVEKTLNGLQGEIGDLHINVEINKDSQKVYSIYLSDRST